MFNPQAKPKPKFDTTPVPDGMHPARIARVIEQGEHETVWQGEAKVNPKVSIMFVLGDTFIELKQDDGSVEKKGKAVFFNSTLSSHERSKLMGIISSVKPDCTNLGQLVNLPCLVQTEMNGDYCNIKSVTPIIAGMDIKELDCDSYYFSYDEPSKEIWDKLHDKTKEKLMSAKNYKGSAVEAMVLGNTDEDVVC
jgi:hypothetical protein